MSLYLTNATAVLLRPLMTMAIFVTLPNESTTWINSYYRHDVTITSPLKPGSRAMERALTLVVVVMGMFKKQRE